MQIDPEAMAEAFNASNTRLYWGARPISTTNKKLVYFANKTGAVSLQYDTDTGLFHVVFNRAVASFGDYANAIAKALLTVLSTLEAGGMPFSAPQGLEGMEIVLVHHGIGSNVTVRPPSPPPVSPEDLAFHEGDLAFGEEDCPGHVASPDDNMICGLCGIHINALAPDPENGII